MTIRRGGWSRRHVLVAGASSLIGGTVFAKGSSSSGSGSGAGPVTKITASGSGDLPPTPFRFTPFTVEMPVPQVLQPVTPFATSCSFPTEMVRFPVQYYRNPMRPAVTQIIPGVNTPVWTYSGTYPGPTIKARAFQPTVVRFSNGLPVETSVHNHGQHSPSDSDGFPADFVFPGASKDYCYPNFHSGGDDNENPSTLWYHDHAMDITGENVYRGLGAFYLVTDALEDALIASHKLPGPDADVPMVFGDKRFNADGTLFYDPLNHDGFLGDVFVVNGKAQPVFHVQRKKYRLRFLDGSNARFYALRLSTGAPLTVIGHDSWLLPRAVSAPYVLISPAKRWDVVVDFRNAPAELFLENILVQNDGRGPEGTLQEPKLQIPGFPLVKFVVSGAAQNNATVVPGDPLRPMTLIRPEEIRTTRSFLFERRDGAWQINHRFFDPNRVDANPKLGVPERWILKNGGGGWWHPIHIHHESHQVVAFNGRPIPPEERIKSDTTILGPGDEAEIYIRFRDFTGRFVFHCHNLEHEDMRMMSRFDVVP